MRRPEAFLDTVGAGTAARRTALAAPRPSAPRAGIGLAAAPVLAMLAALALVAAIGLSRRSGVPPALETALYGFFSDRYPLFAFALVYGLARIAAGCAAPGPATVVRRALFGLAGLLVLGLAGLYPTFGGLVLRAGFATGGMAFLTNLPLWPAYALGAGAAAALFGGIVGASVVAASRPLRPGLARLGGMILSFLALWFGAALLGLGRDLGLGPWPARGMSAAEAGVAALLLLAAALPHALLTARRRRPA